MLWGAELCLAMTWGGGWRHWGPLSVDMRPYGCFIRVANKALNVANHWSGGRRLLTPMGWSKTKIQDVQNLRQFPLVIFADFGQLCDHLVGFSVEKVNFGL